MMTTARGWSRCARALAALALGLWLGACDRIMPQPADLSLPDVETVRSTYAGHGLRAEFRYSGNVLEMVVQQPPDQLRRGGPLWARVGPYIYLFSPGTRDLFEDHPGLAGVRAITMEGTTEVARAMLVREALTEIGWRRALNVLGQALEEGTTRPSTMDRLVQFGEQHTEYEYNPDYVPPR
ncbi:MAG TPA: hypothetical protein VK936_10210 [Longimicrobiales bacterium]|nr:hypothetical protein [Longimicrobiales bacterium]